MRERATEEERTQRNAPYFAVCAKRRCRLVVIAYVIGYGHWSGHAELCVYSVAILCVGHIFGIGYLCGCKCDHGRAWKWLEKKIQNRLQRLSDEDKYLDEKNLIKLQPPADDIRVDKQALAAVWCRIFDPHLCYWKRTSAYSKTLHWLSFEILHTNRLQIYCSQWY